jgi:hypothetical protein
VFLLNYFRLAPSRAKSVVILLDEEVRILFQDLLPLIQQGSGNHTRSGFP